MKNFLKIADGVQITSLLSAITRQPELWDEFPVRTQHPGTAHSEVSDILLRFNAIPGPDEIGRIIDDKQCECFPAWSALPQARPIVFDLMRLVEGVQLGRVMITKLPPGKTITPHVDGGAPATFYERFHVALQSLPGAIFRIGEEAVQFRAGEVWRIDNCVEHEVINHSQDDRIVMIVDIRCE